MLKLYDLHPDLDKDISQVITDKEFCEVLVKFENGLPVLIEKKKKKLYRKDQLKK
jgi:hypothetical protein